MSAHMADSTYDGDAASVSALNQARAQSPDLVASTSIAGDGGAGEIDGDTTAAVTSSTATRSTRNVVGEKKDLSRSCWIEDYTS